MKTWFITGASRGFGAKVAQLALAKGENVVATARNTDALTDRLVSHPNLLALPLMSLIRNRRVPWPSRLLSDSVVLMYS